MRAFKTFSARRVNELRRMEGTPLRQRGYCEHVVRNDEDLARIREYIFTNPARWAEDEHNPAMVVRASSG